MSKATNKRSIIDVIKRQKRDAKRTAGIARANASGISGAYTAITSGPKSQASASNDTIGDLNMHTYDIKDVDRLYFSTTAGSTDTLLSTDTGIESLSSYDGTTYTSYGMKFQIPNTNIFQFNIGSKTDCLNIGTTFSYFSTSLGIIGSVDIYANYIQVDETTPTLVGTVPADERRLFSDSTNNSELSVKKSDGTVVSLEGGSSGATTELDNLGTTSVNANIIPQAGKILGSDGNEWVRVHSNNYRLGTAGSILSTSNDIAGGSGGITFNVPSDAGQVFDWKTGGASKMTLTSGGQLYTNILRATTVMQLDSVTSYPGSNGAIYREGSDVKIFTGGSEVNMTTLAASGSGANTSLSNLTSTGETHFVKTTDNYSNFSGVFYQFYHATGTFNVLMPNINLAGTKVTIAAELKISGELNHDGSTVGFYGTTPISKPTSVAVTASGIHAALVSLGLIT